MNGWCLVSWTVCATRDIRVRSGITVSFVHMRLLRYPFMLVRQFGLSQSWKGTERNLEGNVQGSLPKKTSTSANFEKAANNWRSVVKCLPGLRFRIRCYHSSTTSELQREARWIGSRPPQLRSYRPHTPFTLRPWSEHVLTSWPRRFPDDFRLNHKVMPNETGPHSSKR